MHQTYLENKFNGASFRSKNMSKGTVTLDFSFDGKKQNTPSGIQILTCHKLASMHQLSLSTCTG
jgi:hypothetical protein